jgi:hypothetical protein
VPDGGVGCTPDQTTSAVALSPHLCRVDSVVETAWAAGFFDGEGTSSYSPTSGVTRIQISQKEPELLHRFAAAVGHGSVHGPYRNGKGYVYQYRLSRRQEVRDVMAQLWPFLGTAKRQQAERANLAPATIQ